MLVGIIGAMELEVEALKKLMDNADVEKISSVEFYRGNINGVETVVAVSGVGKVNAAVCTQAMILKYSPDIIINVGVAGGLSDGFKIGDIAIAESVVEHDMDTSPIGDPIGLISGINIINIPCDGRVVELMKNAVSKIDGIKSKCGVIASGDQFISKEEQRKFIKENFDAVATEMEGASIGHVCYMNNVPFGVLRAISDGANDEADMDYPTFAKMAAANSIKIILEMLKNI